MINTISSLIIAIFALLPGIPGNEIYKIIVGFDRRDTSVFWILRLLLFSVLGIVIYVLLALLFNWWMPIYIIPSQVTSAFNDPSMMPKIFIPYLGHILCSAAIGIIMAQFKIFITKFTPFAIYPEPWDTFIRENVKNHWVIVKLKNDITYAGVLCEADISATQDERDLILEEPCIFVEERNNYKALAYQSIFIKGLFVEYIAVVHDPDKDKKRTVTGEYLFKEESNGGKDYSNA